MGNHDGEAGLGDVGRKVISEIRSIDASEAIGRAKAWTSDNPVVAVSIALGVGICVGILIDANRSEPEKAGKPAAVSRFVHQAGNQLKAMAQEVSENVASDVHAKYESVADNIHLPSSSEAISAADTIIATVVSFATKKLQKWVSDRV